MSLTLRAVWTAEQTVWEFSYTGDIQTFAVPLSGYYQLEVWGAQGTTAIVCRGGYGAYTSGKIQLVNNTSLYVYVGQNPDISATPSYNATTTSSKSAFGSGGASDIRVNNGSWNDSTSLRSRVIVAAGGSGAYCNSTEEKGWYDTNGSNGGGLIGYHRYRHYNSDSSASGKGGGTISYMSDGGATQTSGGSGWGGQYGYGSSGSFGIAGYVYSGYFGSDGSGGWYGGGAGGAAQWDVRLGGAGSSYISGHTGCVGATSISSSSPKSGCTTGTSDADCSLTPYINPATNTYYTFTDTVMIDGAGHRWYTSAESGYTQMPNPEGGYYASGVGHSGNGAARITYLGPAL